MNDFATRLLAWFDTHGRRDLPWQHPRTPYTVWLSEVMLQQTQVRTVIPFFQRFVAALPNLADLAAAPLDRVLGLWSGLGYYTRARNLHRSAEICIDIHAGTLPRDFAALSALPGLGRSTAAAILAQAYDERHAILDGNVCRVLARYHGMRGWPGDRAVQNELWAFAESHTPAQRVADYTQAIMDLGATICTRVRPLCSDCPLATDCVALQENSVALLPESRRRKPLPRRATTMLICRDARQRILLERRPPSGVWARLWSLPEVNTADGADELMRQRVGHVGRNPIPLPNFVHTFSHFRLQISPLLFDCTNVPTAIGDNPDLAWFSPAELAHLGLPAPVRKLLESLEESPT